MAVPWTEWKPSNLRKCWKNGNDLKPSSTTASYTGGDPSAMTDIKPSIVNYSTGNLKLGLVTPDGTDLKPSLKPITTNGGGTIVMMVISVTMGSEVAGLRIDEELINELFDRSEDTDEEITNFTRLLAKGLFANLDQFKHRRALVQSIAAVEPYITLID